MCKIKTGKNICTDQDLQNLITSVILRQSRSFTINLIAEQTRDKLKDSNIALKDQQVEKMVSNTLNVLECNEMFGVKDGIYNKKEIIFV